MKARSRYILLAAFAVIAVPLAIGAWTWKFNDNDPNDNNDVGFDIAIICLLVIVCIYAATGAGWLEGKARKSWRDRRAKRLGEGEK